MVEHDIKPRIGLVAESDLDRHLLAGLLDEAGYDLTLSLNTTRLASRLAETDAVPLDEQIDAWLLDLGEQHIQQALDLLAEHSNLPLLVNDEIPSPQDTDAHQYWKRRLIEKLELIAVPGGDRSGRSSDELPAELERIWVLAASFGGPEAVKQFLGALPPSLPLAMVYGQHIDRNFDRVLASAIGANRNYIVRLLRGRSQLIQGEVAVIPADHQVRFLTRGEAVETRRSWTGPYQPALDQIISELARLYRDRLGVIVFSGMCNDGEIGCRVAKACGSTVWVQSPESCMSDDMPNAALSTGSVSFQGDPIALAKALAEYTTGATGVACEGPPTLGAGQR